MFDFVFFVSLGITLVTVIPVVLQLRNHPKGLYILFFAEMWERFSYYGMRGLLIFYLGKHFLFTDPAAQGQFGAYTALVYLLPLIGGFLADRILGTRKAIVFGALLLVAGHMTMAIEGPTATQVLNYQGAAYNFEVQGRGSASEIKLRVGEAAYDYGPAEGGGLEIKGLPANSPLPSVLPKGEYKLSVDDPHPIFRDILYLALALIIMGVGFLKANISSIVGQLYPERDPRRDPGFTLYYYGINLGALWASVLCGGIGERVGWWAGFGLAGLGMAAGLIVFVLGKPLLQGKGEPPNPERLAKPIVGPITRETVIYAAGLLGVGLVWLVLVFDARVRGWMLAAIDQFKEGHPGQALPFALSAGNFLAVVGALLVAGSIAVLGYIGWVVAKKCTAIERDRVILALVLIGASVIFWTLFEQAGSSLNQFADRNTQLRVGPWPMTAAQVQAFNSGFILIGAPLFAALWAFLQTRRLDPNPALKFALALMQVGLSLIIVILGAQFADADSKVPLIFLALAYAVQTTGELCLSPVGLSQMTRLSPAFLLSTVMATWFLASSWAQWLGGFVAQFTAADTVAGRVLDPAKALATYVTVYGWLGWVTVGLGVLLALASPWLKKLAHGADREPT